MRTRTKLAKTGAAMMALGIAVDLTRLLLGHRPEPIFLNVGFMAIMLLLFLLIASRDNSTS